MHKNVVEFEFSSLGKVSLLHFLTIKLPRKVTPKPDFRHFAMLVPALILTQKTIVLNPVL